ncbi:ubiquinol-cytochrome c reductase iron-sulfur subunit [Aestuariicella sp. G3-2]|uniref:QcrA and Rieske domain-containing protein n=1 Tax=Pseudomaricurvus albidus TaxID=2842452 RepID=UPI001C0C4CFD|nr:ubiquinol-cytochrome c reductase iron-sulfur subunit [Aestuariicella albida]MBU3069166.1 ubiquinol-cytochrome c reductase iron-sulfur subunit [Aestuariicella albida]
MRRRDLILAMGALPLIASDTHSQTSRQFRVSIEGLSPGGVKRVVAPGRKIVHIVRRPHETQNAAVWDTNAEWLVVLASCTHQGCEPRPGVLADGGWRCLCHGSEFDLAGHVIKGPATEDLMRLPYSLKEQWMTIHFHD